MFKESLSDEEIVLKTKNITSALNTTLNIFSPLVSFFER